MLSGTWVTHYSDRHNPLPMSPERTRAEWWPGRELNPRHADFQSAALPTELPGLSGEPRIKQARRLTVNAAGIAQASGKANGRLYPGIMHVQKTRVECMRFAMRPPKYDAKAPKQTVSITLNSDLYAQAKELGINTSQVTEEALSYEVDRRRAQLIKAEIRKDIEALDAYEAKHGSFVEMVREHYQPEGSDEDSR